MYYYILDPQKIPAEKFERLQTELQGFLAEFNVSGETARVTPIRNIADLVDTAAQRGAKTLIACGTDDTFNVMLASLKGRDFTIGFIPFDENSNLKKILGLDDLFTSIKTIAARRIERIDLARINTNYFINFLEFGVTSQNIQHASLWTSLKILSQEPKKFTIRIDDSYNVTIDCMGGLVANIRSSSSHTEKIANPTDGFLDLLILERLSKTQILRYRQVIADGCLEKVPRTTVIKCRKIEFLEPRGFPVTMLGRPIAKFPAMVEIIPQRLKLIVGKNRTF